MINANISQIMSFSLLTKNRQNWKFYSHSKFQARGRYVCYMYMYATLYAERFFRERKIIHKIVMLIKYILNFQSFHDFLFTVCNYVGRISQ